MSFDQSRVEEQKFYQETYIYAFKEYMFHDMYTDCSLDRQLRLGKCKVRKGYIEELECKEKVMSTHFQWTLLFFEFYQLSYQEYPIQVMRVNLINILNLKALLAIGQELYSKFNAVLSPVQLLFA